MYQISESFEKPAGIFESSFREVNLTLFQLDFHFHRPLRHFKGMKMQEVSLLMIFPSKSGCLEKSTEIIQRQRELQ